MTSARILGGLFIVVGLALSSYFMFSFDTTVASESREVFGQQVGGGRTHNLGLLADRQNGVVFGVGLANLGGLLLIAGLLPIEKHEKG
jgi:hypothetical protein